ncbi:MAG: divalent-cation tolerance protein CutA [Lysobacterales bacterium]
MSDILLVQCTCPEADAERLAQALVGESLAACVNQVGPVRSVYRWEGAIESGTEMLLLIKTTRACYPALQARLQELHPYEVPEIIALPVSAGLPAYLQWLRESVG